MTDEPHTLAAHRLPWRRDPLKQTGALAPVLRFVPRHPGLMIGAAVLGVAGIFAWRNREKISAKAKPMIADARTRGRALMDEAKVKGHEAVETTRAKVRAAKAKAAAARADGAARTASSEPTPVGSPTSTPAGTPTGVPDLH